MRYFAVLFAIVSLSLIVTPFSRSAGAAPTYTVTPSAGANGTISPNTPQTVSQNASVTFTATANADYAVDTWSVDGAAAQTGGASFTLTKVKANHTVNVTFKRSACIVTPTAGANGSISPDTPQTVAYNGSVSFTATASAGYAVDKWSLDGVVAQSGGASYTLSNVTTDHAVAVTFKQLTYTVTPASGPPHGNISPSTPQTVAHGGSVTFTAIPRLGYFVDTWAVDDVIVQVGGTTFALDNVTADHSVSVSFGRAVVTPSAGPNGSISPDTPQTVAPKGTVTFTAAPDSGYAIDAWSVDGVMVQEGGTDFTLSNITADHTVSVTFERSTHTVTPTAGANGSITPSAPQTVVRNGAAAFTATPDTGYTIDAWSVDGVMLQEGGTDFTLSDITADHTVSVTFKRSTYTVTPTAGANGSINPSAPQTVAHDGAVAFTALPDTGFAVDTWSVDGATVQTGGTGYTLSGITANHTVNVTFSAITGSLPTADLTYSGSHLVRPASGILLRVTAAADSATALDQSFADATEFTVLDARGVLAAETPASRSANNTVCGVVTHEAGVYRAYAAFGGTQQLDMTVLGPAIIVCAPTDATVFPLWGSLDGGEKQCGLVCTPGIAGALSVNQFAYCDDRARIEAVSTTLQSTWSGDTLVVTGKCRVIGIHGHDFRVALTRVSGDWQFSLQIDDRSVANGVLSNHDDISNVMFDY